MKISVFDFLSIQDPKIILDVRSPGEYHHAHIPGAISFPLFSDEERATVGTAYKQESREIAIKIGLDFFGPKMRKMVELAEEICAGDENKKTVIVHCWRGGMRSAAVAWLLDLYGFKVYLLKGGYKAFRHWVLEQFEKTYSFSILGGNTGSGKTYILSQLQQLGQTTIDLEGLASHKGSAFGNIGMPDQPSQEMFENKLATELFQKSKDEIWLEDESQRIGTVNIPNALWQTMKKSKVYYLQLPFDERLKFIVQEYGNLDLDRLVNATTRIKKRLGDMEAKNAIQFLLEGNVVEAFRILLKYYDKYYQKSLQKKDISPDLLMNISCDKVDAESNAKKLLSAHSLIS